MNQPTQTSATGLALKMRDQLIQKALERKARGIEQTEEKRSIIGAPGDRKKRTQLTSFEEHPGYQRYKLISDGAKKLGVANPFFQEMEGLSSSTAMVGGRELINFSGYNYLGLAGHPAVNLAAAAAIERFGTSVSASRIVSGERSLHRELEHALADLHGADDAVVMVSGHATTVTTLGYLFGPRDLILHDALIHNCALEGARLSGAKRMSFPHNDWNALDQILARCSHEHERVCVVVEGLYSMDGDFPDLPHFIEIKNKYGAFLMVDEAHSLGTMGRRGLGIAEYFDINRRDVDIWMGTLSKSLASCGGYISGCQALIDNLKFAAPGFVYSVGMSPPLAAAALEALRILIAEPDRVSRLQSVSAYFLEKSRVIGLEIGHAQGVAIVPAITGSSLKAARLSHALRNRGVNAQPILYPAVSEQAARLRFFLSCEHTFEQIDCAIVTLSSEWNKS
jgi:8-amino-7-oxononanoate synthase